MNKTYKRNLSFGFGLSLLILLVSTIASYISINSLLISSDQVAATHAFIKELDNISGTLADAETGQRGFLLTGDNNFLDPYRGAGTKANAALEKVRSFITDQPAQQQNYNTLEKYVTERLNILRDLIDKKRTGGVVNINDFKIGKDHMDEVRRLVNLMETGAQNALIKRTERLNNFAVYTRIMIVVASLLALLITVIFYLRVKKDFEERTKLQNEMIDKDRSISERITMIHEIANKVSLGNYSNRITNEGKDTLGSLADSLNKMAESLEHSFGLLSDKEWLQSGASELNERMMGGTNLARLCENIINYMVTYTNSQVGAVYIIENEVLVKLYASYGLSTEGTKKILSLGEGMAGQCALDGQIQLLENIEDTSIIVNYAAGIIKPKNIIAFALYNEGIIKGVIEIASINSYSKRDLAFIDLVSSRIAGVINRVQNRVKMQELLEETQSQTEELHTQHNELQNLNAELEANTQKLQSSEEELRIQQEELLAVNKELKDRAYLLQEKNQMIQERNVEIQRKAEELELTTRYKSEFLANMSHELRTPLNSILLLSGLMVTNSERKLNEEYIEYAKVIQSSGNGLLLLIDEILDLSKIESGKMQLDYEVVALQEIAQSMESMFKAFATQKEIDFRVMLHPDATKTIQTDRMRLEQILKNLLSNAFKFTPNKGRIDFNISIAPNDPHFISFAIKDNGIGIAKEKQALIFEAFQQEDGSTRRKFGGTGLGLSISRELIKLLNGKLELQSEVGAGSEFTASVPLVAVDINQPEQESIMKFKNKVPGKKSSGPTDEIQPALLAPTMNDIEDDKFNLAPSDKLLLIIEDDISLAKILLDFTRKNGYKGIVATRGDEGIELAKKFKPGGVLLDIQLPVKNGWEVMEVLKQDAETKHIPVHIMSANSFEKESLQKGADDFIYKPVAFEKIKTLLTKLHHAATKKEKKAMIIEDDPKHATALAYYLATSDINTKIKHNLKEGIDSLLNEDIDCVILDQIGTEDSVHSKLDEVRKISGLESLPIIVYISRNISKAEEAQLRKYADTVIVKTSYSYKRMLEEVSLFLHVVEDKKKILINNDRCNKLGALSDVLKDKTVLVADDDVRNIFSLTKALETYKVKVIAAMDGKEALAKLEENPEVDIVLMDMMMPEMDGYEATTQLKNDVKLKHIPVIAVTAKAMVGDREKCIEAGASDYITKPVDIDQLLSLLRVWLYEKQFQRADNAILQKA